ncbi:hypothetical protein PENTCL1PPCAC_5930, partial [Pristionchus entomophagus]
SNRSDYNSLGQRVAHSTSNDSDDEEDFMEETARCQTSIVERTALGDGKSDSDRKPLREKFTLDATLTRYACWNHMKMDLFVHCTLIIVSQLYISVFNVLHTTSHLKSRQQLSMQTPLCWCDNTYTMGNVQRYLDEIRPITETAYCPRHIFKIVFLACGLSSVMWERWLGRRSALLLALSVSAFSLLTIHFTDYRHFLLRHLAWTLEYMTSGAVMIISYTSFIELLPKKWRVIGAGFVQMAMAFSDWIGLVSIHLIPNKDYHLVIFAYRIWILFFAIYFAKEPISHLIVQGRYTDVDNVLYEEEVELRRKNRAKLGKSEESSGWDSSTNPSTESDIPQELKQARLITDDLAYRDDDDYTPWEFICLLPRSKVFFLLCATFAVSAMSGLMDRMTVIYLGQFYIEGEILVALKIIIKTTSAFTLFVHRKWHRCRTMIFLLAIAIVTMSARLLTLRLETNTCSIRRRVPADQQWLGLVYIFFFHLAVECLKAVSLLYVAELTPSVLRMSAITLVSFVNSLSRELTHVWTSEDKYKSIMMCLGVMTILLLMLRRKVTDSPEIFCIYLNDLVPRAPTEEDEEDEEDNCNVDETRLDVREEDLDKDRVIANGDDTPMNKT